MTSNPNPLRPAATAAVTPSTSSAEERRKATPANLFQNRVVLTWFAWVVSRALMIRLIAEDTGPFGDVSYYYRGVTGIEPTALQEYPAVGIWPIQVLQGLMQSSEDSFRIGFVVMCLILDAIFMGFLMRRQDSRSLPAAWFWIVFGVCALHVLVMRLDIFPGIVVGLAAYCVVGHPRVAASLLAVATAMKLWPGVLAAGLVRNFRSTPTWNAILAFVGTLVALCAVVASYGGISRITSPLTYQGDRGLQVESILATPFTFQAVTNPSGDYSVAYTDFKAFEVFGPGVEAAASATSLLMAVTVMFAFGWAVWRLFTHTWSARVTIVWMIFMVFALIVSNKVFSPQYIVWVGPLIAVALILLPRARLLWAIAGLTLAMAALGTIVYPFYYNSIVVLPSGTNTGVYALALRNALMVCTFITSGVWLLKVARDENKDRAK